ncbi:hypothetical protein WG66_004075 [Moniliophthora roreri]|nr:hypothetical protein WG66_004075 [Moniliophthora roreri]
MGPSESQTASANVSLGRTATSHLAFLLGTKILSKRKPGFQLWKVVIDDSDIMRGFACAARINLRMFNGEAEVDETRCYMGAVEGSLDIEESWRRPVYDDGKKRFGTSLAVVTKGPVTGLIMTHTSKIHPAENLDPRGPSANPQLRRSPMIFLRSVIIETAVGISMESGQPVTPAIEEAPYA